jgi:hypothetical protein|tara:strand:- start:4048 stop:5019 length:972 start_codon:yes stop_codon:yes gene_type:complete
MAQAKIFNNVILGQFVLSGVPIKVYASGRFLTLTDTDDIEDPTIGFGMDENGEMIQFSYPEVEFLQVSGNKIDITTYNKGMAAVHGGEEEAPADAEEDEGSNERPDAEDLKDNLHRIGKLVEGPASEKAQKVIDKLKSSLIKAKEDKLDAEKEELGEDQELTERLAKGLKPLLMIGSKVGWNTMSEDALLDLSDKFDELGDEDADSIASHLNMSIELRQDGYRGDATKMMKQFNKVCADVLKGKPVTSVFENVNEHGGSEYTFGTGDIVHDKDPGCNHFGSKGIVITADGDMIRYTVTNGNDKESYRPGDILTKSADKLENYK